LLVLHELCARRPRRRARAAPRLEPLEARRLPSAALVQDINTNTVGSDPRQLVKVGGTVFFTADDGVHGRELWKSDGTAAGTALVADLVAGAGSAALDNLTAVGGRLFFTFNDGGHGDELWESDGTAAGTHLVKDVNPGAGSSNPGSLTALSGKLFFTADDGSHGRALWESDGTAAGTAPVKQVAASQLTPAGATLFFVAPNGASGPALWKSDGTAAGTVALAGVSAEALTAVNGTLYFTTDAPGQPQLWRSDGTAAGTTMLKSLAPSVAGAGPLQSLTAVGGRLFFLAPDPGGAQQLWESDGTAAGTVPVYDFFNTWTVDELTAVGNQVFFRVSISDGGGAYAVWSSDGTAAGTSQVLGTPYDDLGGAPNDLTDVNGRLFLAFDPGSAPGMGDDIGEELYGPGLVKDIDPGFQDPFAESPVPNSSNPADLTNVNGTLFFSADDGAHGRQLWKSDGTAAGTVMVKDITATGTAGSSPQDLTPVGGTLFFSADDGVDGRELWKTTGTGATLVKDIAPGPAGSDPQNLTAFNGRLFFTATTADSGTELWTSDGTAAGTQMLLDINATSAFDPTTGADVPGSSDPAGLTVVGNRLFFTADDGVHGPEVWQTDGTAAGTTLVADIGPAGSYPEDLTAVNGTLFFSADDGTHGRELWKSNGTAAGTVLVKDIDPGAAGSGPEQLTALNGKVFFYANDGTHGAQLWESDGTAAGTVAVAPGRWNGVGGSPTAVGGELFFTASDSTHGWELWRTDGTPAGTALVKDVTAGGFTVVGGTLYFTGNDGTGWGLWKTDGTAAGTVLVKSARPSGAPATDPWWVSAPVAVGGTLYFTASDSSSDSQLWRSDGTSAGTVLVQDMRFAAAGNGHADLTNVGGTLFFTLGDAAHGRELWKASPSGSSNVKGGADLSGTEGAALSGTLATFTDPAGSAAGHYTAVIDWGDGTTTAGTVTASGGRFSVAGTHAYRRYGLYTPRVTVRDDGGSAVSVTDRVHVADAPLSAKGTSASAVAGQAFAGAVASFTDANPFGKASDYIVQVDWGDGQTSAGTAASDGHGGFTVRGKHTYARKGTYRVQVRVRDSGGSAATAQSSVKVSDPPRSVHA
jgi:ELWxxDGT repeat protein